MALWIIEPHDPIIFRDGKPFGPTPGAQAKSLVFPFPSTTTGGARTRAGSDEEGRFIKSGELDAIKNIAVRGPLLVQLSEDSSEPTEWLFPAPADALIFEPRKEKGETHYRVKQLEPVTLPAGAIVSPMSSTEDATAPRKLKLVGLAVSDPSKPAKDAPLYWYKEHFYRWLSAPSELQKFSHLSGLGHSGPVRQQRIHVSIDPETAMAKEGMLFGTNGLEFTHTDKKRLSGARRLALAIDVNEEKFSLREGLAPLGGERRTVAWHKSSVGLPECPPELKEAIKSEKACRLILLTPAHFAQGYYPTWILSEREGVKPTLEAIAVQRPQVVSGWDFEKGGPKPTRRLAPAGTVLFLSFKGNSPGAIEAWIEKTWMQCVSDNGQDRLDGFGLAVLGRWVSPEAVKEISVKERA